MHKAKPLNAQLLPKILPGFSRCYVIAFLCFCLAGPHQWLCYANEGIFLHRNYPSATDRTVSIVGGDSALNKQRDTSSLSVEGGNVDQSESTSISSSGIPPPKHQTWSSSPNAESSPRRRAFLRLPTAQFYNSSLRNQSIPDYDIPSNDYLSSIFSPYLHENPVASSNHLSDWLSELLSPEDIMLLYQLGSTAYHTSTLSKTLPIQRLFLDYLSADKRFDANKLPKLLADQIGIEYANKAAGGWNSSTQSLLAGDQGFPVNALQSLYSPFNGSSAALEFLAAYSIAERIVESYKNLKYWNFPHWMMMNKLRMKTSDAPQRDHEATNSDWDYKQQGEDWEGLHCEAGLLNQSPINFEGFEVDSSGNHKIEFNLTENITSFELSNSGKGLTFNAVGIPGGAAAPFGSVSTGGEVFAVKQFHFHSPGEHTFGGVENRRDVELHIVCANEGGNLLVVGVTFVAAENGENAFMDAVSPFISFPPPTGEAVPVNVIPQPISLQSLVKNSSSQGAAGVGGSSSTSSNSAGFYTYSGSLTTPPCSEPVLWYVLKEPISASKCAINAFKKFFLFEGSLGNYRLVQNTPDKPHNVKKATLTTGTAL